MKNFSADRDERPAWCILGFFGRRKTAGSLEPGAGSDVLSLGGSPRRYPSIVNREPCVRTFVLQKM